MSDDDFKFYKKLIQCINPIINVRKINESEIVNGFNNLS